MELNGERETHTQKKADQTRAGRHKRSKKKKKRLKKGIM
jgi:hypothetical protein